MSCSKQRQIISADIIFMISVVKYIATIGKRKGGIMDIKKYYGYY